MLCVVDHPIACYDILMTTIRAHFDGKVFVPDEPVDLPVGQHVNIPVMPKGQAIPPPPEGGTLAGLADWIGSLPPLPEGTLPADLAAQHDHYLYGTPKRP